MSHDLYKVSRGFYAVKSSKTASTELFNSIEEAAEFMETALGISSDEIDSAIIHMATHLHTHAQFGVGISSAGPLFIFSDNEKIDVNSF